MDGRDPRIGAGRAHGRPYIPAAMYDQRNPASLLHRIPDRPLIDHVTNEWQKNPKYHNLPDCYHEDDYGGFTYSGKPQRLWCCPFGLPRRPRRLLALYVAFLVSALCLWRYFLKPNMDHDDKLDMSMRMAILRGNKDFGINARPQFADMLQLRHLDSKYLPGATHSGITRLVIVGDVHGCKTELEELLKKLDFDKRRDHLIFTGDMIFNGPDSLGVVDLARDLGASCVRGNHEDRTLLALSSMRGSFAAAPTAAPGASSTAAVTVPSNDAIDKYSHGDDAHVRLALSLSPGQVDWLSACPCILHLGRLAGRDWSVAHGGLAPGIDWERQDPFQVMNMRSIDLDTRVPTELRVGEPWYNVWNHYMKNMPAQRRRMVAYGHDSKVGLNLQKYSKGLDSGCVFGGRLTALTLDGEGKEKVVSVKCKKYVD